MEGSPLLSKVCCPAERANGLPCTLGGQRKVGCSDRHRQTDTKPTHAKANLPKPTYQSQSQVKPSPAQPSQAKPKLPNPFSFDRASERSEGRLTVPRLDRDEKRRTSLHSTHFLFVLIISISQIRRWLSKYVIIIMLNYISNTLYDSSYRA